MLLIGFQTIFATCRYYI